MVKPLEGALYAAVGGISSAVLAAHVIYPHIWRDLKFIRTAKEPLSRIARYLSAEPPVTIVDRFLHQVQLQPDKPFLLFENEVYTYKDMDVMSNKVANYFRGEGYRCGDTVAMLISNEPAFIWTFLGLAKLGVKMAFLNTNLRTRALLHCFNVAEAKALIVGQGEGYAVEEPVAPEGEQVADKGARVHDELLDAAAEISSELHQKGVAIWLQGDRPPPHGFLPLVDNIKRASDQPIAYKLRATLSVDDPMCYIYTSGTTGLPKASALSWRNSTRLSVSFAFAGLKSHDVLYVCLPLYHMSGMCVGVGCVIEQGATLALARKFSAGRFWDDCRKHNAAMILYIGELLRYLCAQPKAKPSNRTTANQAESPNDKKHNVRLAFGNGLSGDVWKQFQHRFGVKQIVEVYGMTEGVTSYINLTNTPGVVGIASPLLKVPNHILKVDPETNEVIRDGNGRCIEVKRGEPGLLIAPITSERPFYGYKGKKEVSEKKILRNVFKEGDAYFNTGDLMRVDKDYYVYFVDRLGDTFSRLKLAKAPVTYSKPSPEHTPADQGWLKPLSHIQNLPPNTSRPRLAEAPVTYSKPSPEHTPADQGWLKPLSHIQNLPPNTSRPRLAEAPVTHSEPSPEHKPTKNLPPNTSRPRLAEAPVTHSEPSPEHQPTKNLPPNTSRPRLAEAPVTHSEPSPEHQPTKNLPPNTSRPRWKGENVATTEVSQAISEIEGVQEANVYGVKVPGHEGRAGMAAIVLHPGHQPNFQKWYAHLASRLPSYARPLVLRLTKEMEITGTFKQKKAGLVKEGFDPSVVSDPMYFRDDSKKSYVPLDTEVFKKVALGSAKL
ncbi:hypothetical protein Bbelb_141160 [Branchiostoma belcheri]|nr:hypothetical protein Bbelb_141160 [Branchiostoma belcheri]